MDSEEPIVKEMLPLHSHRPLGTRASVSPGTKWVLPA